MAENCSAVANVFKVRVQLRNKFDGHAPVDGFERHECPAGDAEPKCRQ